MLPSFSLHKGNTRILEEVSISFSKNKSHDFPFLSSNINSHSLQVICEMLMKVTWVGGQSWPPQVCLLAEALGTLLECSMVSAVGLWFRNP